MLLAVVLMYGESRWIVMKTSALTQFLALHKSTIIIETTFFDLVLIYMPVH